MAVTYDIVPGQSVGIFQLGDSLWHILDVLRTLKVEYPKVEVSWDPDDPIKSANVIHLPFLTLYFPPSAHQTLQLIVLPSITSGLTLVYEENTLSSSSTALTRGRVGKVLGPTYAGSSSSKLVYPGITFDLEGNGNREDRVGKISVKPREEVGRSTSALVSAVIQPGEGVVLRAPDPLSITLGSTTAQDLLLDLGPPLRKFYKEDDRLERMWGTAAQDSEKGSCFWNYFQYGLDFLISPSGLVIKVILYSNIEPGTPLFQRYARCPWTISTSSGSLDYTSTLGQFRSALTGRSGEQGRYTDEVRLVVPGSEKGGKKKKRGGSPSSISSGLSATKSTEDVSTAHTPSPTAAEDAMVLDRVGEGGLDGVKGVGLSRLVGFEGLVVEEDQDSGGICSILVYQNTSQVRQ